MPTPERTCIGCRSARPAAELIRIVRDDDGTLRPAGTSAGRGAWLCRGSMTCVQEAIRRRAFGRALRTEVSTDAARDLEQRLADELS